MSVANAKENLKAENNGWNFDEIKTAAVNKWNFYLGKIEVESDNDERLTQFYTHLYHALIHPNICSDIMVIIWGQIIKSTKLTASNIHLSAIGTHIVGKPSYWQC